VEYLNPFILNSKKIDDAVRSLYKIGQIECKGIHNEEWKEAEHGFLTKVPGGQI
jgi:hypothetical protein